LRLCAFALKVYNLMCKHSNAEVIFNADLRICVCRLPGVF
jgi:hypothetical protein